MSEQGQFMDRISCGRKCILGMVHCLPLPGTLNYGGNIEQIYKQALSDAVTLEAAGADGVIVENTNDLPYTESLELEQIAMLAGITKLVASNVSIPVGVSASFNDGRAGIAVAYAAGAGFIRSPVFVDNVQVTGVGNIHPCAKEVLRYRRFLGAEHIRILADVQVKHSHPLIKEVSLEESSRIAVDYGADILVVTGISTGRETPLEAVKCVKNTVEIPVIVGSGFNKRNAADQLREADGAIVGSAIKSGGNTMNPVCMDLCTELLKEVRAIEDHMLSLRRLSNNG